MLVSFLNNGYLQDNETAEIRGHDIAVAAEKSLKIKGFAENFEDYLRSEDFILYLVLFGLILVEKEVYQYLVMVYTLKTAWTLFLTSKLKLVCKPNIGSGTSGYFGELKI